MSEYVFIKSSGLREATDAEMTANALITTAVVDQSASTGYTSKKTPFSKLANYILNKYSALSLGGAARTVKAAIDDIESRVSNTFSEFGLTMTDSYHSQNSYITVYQFGSQAIMYYNVSFMGNTSGDPFVVADMSEMSILPYTDMEWTVVDQSGSPWTVSVFNDGSIAFNAIGSARTEIISGTVVFPVVEA